MKILKEQKSKNLLNAALWLIVVSFVGYGIRTAKVFTLFEKENLTQDEYRKNLTRTGPFLFWRGDSVDVHEVDAGFMQYYDAKKRLLSKEEAQNTSFTCYTQNESDKISFKLHPIDIPPTEYPMPEKAIMVAGDISNFKGMKTFFVNNGVINDKCEWTFGKGHLIIQEKPRSMESTFLWWLLYKLEREAAAAGGKLHVVLGSSPFSFLEKRDQGSMLMERNFVKLNDWTSDTVLQKNSEIGRWFFSKNVVEKMGDYIISTNGINSDISDSVNLEQINNLFRYTYLNGSFGKYNQVTVDKSILKNFVEPNYLNFPGGYNVQSILNGNVAYREEGDSKRDIELNNQTNQTVDDFLKRYNGKHVITSFPFIRDRIVSKHDNKFIGYVMKYNNGGHSINTFEIRYEGLWFENNHVFVINDVGKKERLF